MSQSNGIVKGLLALGMITAFGFASCDSKKAAENKTETKLNSTTTNIAGTNEGRIAYVDMDTLQVKYIFLKSKKEELEKKSANLEAELARGGQILQNEAIAFQKKAQSGGFTTQAEGEAAQQRLQKMQVDLENKRQTLGAQLMKENDAFAKELQDKLDKYLLKYNQDKKYDYILSYQKGGSILFANQSLNITEEVAKGMNEDDKAK
ncbi:OmpH family outer membrane protein [Taibaiella lutea]|uniref:OmpH family outer membrane protein n=1 Tax=Taibaiella lutea TaxID=2608001 RepID=A0A5M6CP82_9BACT|nr:OmpH family outer membrane protein [Taibaiella lutea]KAA5536783.1 OmpH family outer membrane protein [Taibaiella lutea]